MPKAFIAKENAIERFEPFQCGARQGFASVLVNKPERITESGLVACRFSALPPYSQYNLVS
ncbi:MAG TPA: hypothetical protein VJV04_12850 [Nitrospiraceae bacterium]|nr:hypothetical protein [Nitrospiraceae bacterium]